MRLILLGPPGAGKGTQGQRIAARYQIPRISTGDMLRAAAQRGSMIGLQAKQYIDQGLLVPDGVMIDLVEERLLEPDCRDGFLLDGFPRTEVQASALDAFLCEEQLKLDAVIDLEVNEEELIRRLTGRRVCAVCLTNYHLTFAPPRVPGRCDREGAPLTQRDDDRPEPIRQRMQVYKRQTAPVLDYYRREGLLYPIDGMLSEEEVARRIDALLASLTMAAPRAPGVSPPRPAGDPGVSPPANLDRPSGAVRPGYPPAQRLSEAPEG
jgi:adenylate kinase